MPTSSLLSVCSLHLKEVGSSIPFTSADHFGSCSSKSTNTHMMWSMYSKNCKAINEGKQQKMREKEKSKHVNIDVVSYSRFNFIV